MHITYVHISFDFIVLEIMEIARRYGILDCYHFFPTLVHSLAQTQKRFYQKSPLDLLSTQTYVPSILRQAGRKSPE